jgi:hypothetical protein
MKPKRVREPGTLDERDGAFQAGNRGSNPLGDTRSTAGYEGDGAVSAAQTAPSSSPRAHHRKRTDDQPGAAVLRDPSGSAVPLTLPGITPTADLIPASAFPVPVSNYGPGVYLLISGEEIVYVGRAENVSARIHQHCETKDFDRAFCVQVPNEEHRCWVEHWLVRALRPRLNAVIPDTFGYQLPGVLAAYGFGHLVERAANSPTKWPNPKRGRKKTPAELALLRKRRDFNKVLRRHLRAGVLAEEAERLTAAEVGSW